MNQLGSLNGPSPLNALKDLKAKSKKAPERSAPGGPDKPDSTFADLVQQNEPKVAPRKSVADKATDRTEKAEKSERTEKPDRKEENKKASKDAQPDQNIDPAKAEKGSATKKERAMLEFMDSMESELGIPPTEIVAAMALLKPSDYVKPPEETAQQVIENLDLPADEQDKALALYMAFLQQSKTSEMKPDQMFNPQALVAQQMPTQGRDLLTPDQRREKLSQSLDAMNSKFFRTSPLSKGEDASSALGQSSEREGKIALPAGMEALEPIPKAKQPFLTELEMEALSEKLPTAPTETPALMKPDLGKMKAKSEKSTPDDFFALGALKAQMGEGLKAQGKSSLEPEVATKPGEALPEMKIEAGQSQADSGSSELFSQTSQQPKEKGEMTGRKVSADDFFPQLGLGGALKSESPASLNALVSKEALAGPNQQLNVDKLANQAQIITFKGGGEAIVKLTPEGLGEVRMKVLVMDGKVSLEMATETKEAKKLIESSLGDLRASLAGHKLSIDQVKVDVGNQASTDSQSQKQMDTKPDLNQGKQFMSQFRDEMSGRRDQFVEMPGIRSYQAKRQGPDPIGAAPEVSAANRRSLSPGRGQRMNLVA